MQNTVKNTIKSRKIAILAMDGVNDAEVIQIKKALEQKGAYTKVISKALGTVKSIDGEQVPVDMNFVSSGAILFDAVYVPGGQQSVEALKAEGDALHFINEAFKHCKPIGATNEGVDLLSASDIAGVALAQQGGEGNTVSDQGVITVRHTSDLGSFSDKFVEAIAQHRHWLRQQKTKVPA
jgi:catalase